MGLNDFIIKSLQAQVKNLEGRLLLKSEKVVKLMEELGELRADNTTLKDLNEQFAKENIRLRRHLMLGERMKRRRELKEVNHVKERQDDNGDNSNHTEPVSIDRLR